MKFIFTLTLIILGTILLVKRETKLSESRPRILIESNKYGDPIFTWDENERYLRITQYMQRDTFICMRDKCKLVEEWISK